MRPRCGPPPWATRKGTDGLRKSAAGRERGEQLGRVKAVISARLDFITKDKEGNRTNYLMVQRRALALRRSGRIAWDAVVDEHDVGCNVMPQF
jgi:hypothetical protein